MNKGKQFEEKMLYFSTVMFEQNVPVGFVMSDSGKFCLKFSLSENLKTFTTLEGLIDFVLTF